TLEIEDVLNVIDLHGPIRKGIKPFPSVIPQGDIAWVDMGKGILQVPACPDSDDPLRNFLPVLQRLWPFHLKRGKLYKSSSESDHLEGGRRATDLPLHHVYMWFKYPLLGVGDIDCTRARNNDFLDWTGDNLYVPAVDERGKAIS